MPNEIFQDTIFIFNIINKLDLYQVYFLKQEVQFFGFYSKKWI